jgi:hypothetical protein
MGWGHVVALPPLRDGDDSFVVAISPTGIVTIPVAASVPAIILPVAIAGALLTPVIDPVIVLSFLPSIVPIPVFRLGHSPVLLAGVLALLTPPILIPLTRLHGPDLLVLARTLLLRRMPGLDAVRPVFTADLLRMGPLGRPG